MLRLFKDNIKAPVVNTFHDTMCYAPDDVIERRNLSSKLIWIIIITSLIVSFWSFYTSYELKELEAMEYALAYVSIGLGFISVTGVAHSIKTSFDANTKMIQNANINFLQALSDFEKARIKFLNPCNSPDLRYTPEAFTWRSRTHLERATELEKKMIKEKHHHKLIHYFNMSYNALLGNSYNYNDLDNPTKDNVREMYKIVRQYDKGDHETEFNQVLENIGKDPNETEEEFYKRLFSNEK